MKVEIQGIETNVDAMGAIRWMGKWFTHYKMPAYYILLDNEQFALALELRKEHKVPLKKK